METCGFTLYKIFDFDWFLPFSVREYPIQNNSLFLRGTGKLKNSKSPAQKKIPIRVGIVFVQAQSLQYKQEFRKYLLKVSNTTERKIRKIKVPNAWKGL